MKEGTAVVVTTAHRGVFFGRIAQVKSNGATSSRKLAPGRIELTDARCCVYWSRETRGVVGLAATGPASGSKITRAAPRVTLWGVTAVMECSPEAVTAWEAEPWSE